MVFLSRGLEADRRAITTSIRRSSLRIKRCQDFRERRDMKPALPAHNQRRDHEYALAQGAARVGQHLYDLDLNRRPSLPQPIHQTIGKQTARSQDGFVVKDFLHAPAGSQELVKISNSGGLSRCFLTAQSPADLITEGLYFSGKSHGS